MKDVKSDKVTAVTIKQNKEVPTGTITAEFGKDDYKSCEVTDVNQAINDIKKADSYLANKISIKGIDHSGDMISNLIGVVLPIGVVIFFMVMMMRQNGGGGGKMMDFGKSRAKLANPNAKKVTFNDVAGLTEEKEELEEVVEFLKNPGRFIKIGARIPKGVLLVGPPGTGKTLLAKAVAGEANVPFFSISGSDFVEMFVGVGAARVRDLFAEAKKHSPCIVFIDEIDAVARRRGSGLGGGHDEREQTLNQMLVEMDGFGVNEGIIMIAATNRVDILDPAILRPGRFDRKVGVGRPDVKGREDILKIHCRQKPLGDDVDLSKLNQFGQVTIYKQSNPEEVIERIKEADIIITNKCLLTEEVLQYASKVKLICITATGVNNVDLDYCHRRGITVCNVAGYSSLSVAQHTFALALELLHKNSYYHNYVQSGQYSESGMFSHIGPRFYELHEKTWGIIGMGNIGRTVAKIAEAFGCQVQYYSTSGKNTKQDYLSVDLETLLKTSDIVSIHCPLNEQTKGLIGEESFKLMKKEAILINVGRGGIVDEEALVEALQNNEIAGAGLDVFEREPLAKESPLLQINDASKLLMTPHIAWATVEARNRLFDLVVDNIQGFLKGDLKNVC